MPAKPAPFYHFLKYLIVGGACVAQSVRRPSLDLGSCHDLMGHGFEPYVGLCADSSECTWDSLSLFLSPLPLLMGARTLSLSLSLSLKNK